MIRYIVGVPGSGKTYYSVHNIYKSINDKNKTDKYFNIYTNINQFNFDISKKLYKYDHEKIFKCIELLHKYFKKKKSDSFLISMAKKLKVYKSYFVIDEAHLYFDVRKPALIWWLSYHRHLYQDIDLITQNLSLIDPKYKAFAEYFVRASPRSLGILSKTFTYKLFIDSRMSMKSRAGIEKLKQKKEIFDLYVSGGKVNSKNLIRKYLYISLIFLPVSGFLFYYIYHNWSSKDKRSYIQTLPKEKHLSNTVSSSNDIQLNFDSDSRVLNVICIRSVCRYNSLFLPIKALKNLIDQTDSKLLSINTDFRTLQSDVYILASGQFIQLFKGVNDEEISNDLLDGVFSPSRSSSEHK